MTAAEIGFNIAQVQQSQPANPLINQSGEDAIYLGVGLMAVVIILIIGILSRRVGVAIVFSLGVAAVLILLAVLL
jgi:hypothetical protein